MVCSGTDNIMRRRRFFFWDFMSVLLLRQRLREHIERQREHIERQKTQKYEGKNDTA